MNKLSSYQPQNYSRRILLAVAARSPQIVTETIYALMQQEQSGCMPSEVHVITTQQGRPYVEQLLCSQDRLGQLKKLCEDYSLQMPIFDADNIHCISDHKGVELDDVRTRDDNTFAADYITNIVQELTADSNSSLVVSLSGGRRTMTFYVGYALSLFGRPQDRLTHVLVEDEYFFNEEFFYPTPNPLWVVREDNTGFDASKVEVTLADIPFVRLREGLPSALLDGYSSFSHTVSAAQAELAPAKVCFDSSSGCLTCGGFVVTMNSVELSFYLILLQRCQREEAPVRWTDSGLDSAFLEVYAQLNSGSGGGLDRAKKALSHGMTKEYFEQRKSRVNSALRLALGERNAKTYLIDAHGKRPNTRFGVSLRAETVLLI